MTCKFFPETGTDIFPKRPPKSALFVGAAEWSWLPGRDRLDIYWISRTRHKRWWLLWISYYSDVTDKNEYAIYLASDAKFKTRWQAAYELLQDAWKADYIEHGLDRPHDIDRYGILNYEDIETIMTEVWG